ncbi:hypothetical protein Ctaglu_12180 [Clostridium tagluense]|uniref:Uncharacterized protein n=1 Tax=Clostridium tagluense TaxID=360422 RepID=A0A401UJC4_9CLOT|nr:hypothetical protein Ctaglu_12180 [Clostridium tagluense]
MVAPAKGFYATNGLAVLYYRVTTTLKYAIEISGIALEKHMELNKHTII